MKPAFELPPQKSVSPLLWTHSRPDPVAPDRHPLANAKVEARRVSAGLLTMLMAALSWFLAPAVGDGLIAAEPAPPAATATVTTQPTPWQNLFAGETLNGWKTIGYAGAGEITVEDGSIFLGMGAMLTGLSYTNPLPKINYEVTLKAMRIDGSDFFCGLTFPVQDSFCTLIAGGWGGGLVGLSSLDNYDASENETSTFRNFERKRWYSFRLRVTQSRIEAWLDGDPLIDVSIADRKISLRPGEIEMSVPFGISAWQTRAALRDIRLRPLDPAEIPAAPASKP